MKRITLNKVILSFACIGLLISCSEDEEVTYTPKVYEQPTTFSLSVSDETATGFNINVEAADTGSIFYSIQLPNSPAPTAVEIISQKAAGKVKSGRIEIKKDTIISASFDNNNSTYKNDYVVYSLITSKDGIPSEVKKETIQLLDCTPLTKTKNMFLGEYTLTVVSGPKVFKDENVITLSVGENGNLSRYFEAIYFEDGNFGNPPSLITFNLENYQVNIGQAETGLTCDQKTNIILAADESKIMDRPCFDDTIMLNMIDQFEKSGGCPSGADTPFTILLTKKS